MATYVLSDLHGDWIHFRLMLLKIRFSRADHLYILGDVVDRGPHGIRLLQFIRQQENMTLLLGNHDLMLLQSLPHFDDPDGAAWFDPQTYAELRRLSAPERAQLARDLAALPLYLTVSAGGQEYFLVHASPAPPGVSGMDAVEYYLWQRVSPGDVFDVPVIAGHTPTAYYQQTVPLRIWRNGNYTDIDCGTAFRAAVPGACLACLRLDDNKEFYV